MNENKPKSDYTAVREYLRVDTSFPLKFTVITENEYKFKKGLYLKTRTVNRVETEDQPVLRWLITYSDMITLLLVFLIRLPYRRVEITILDYNPD